MPEAKVLACSDFEWFHPSPGDSAQVPPESGDIMAAELLPAHAGLLAWEHEQQLQFEHVWSTQLCGRRLPADFRGGMQGVGLTCARFVGHSGCCGIPDDQRGVAEDRRLADKQAADRQERGDKRSSIDEAHVAMAENAASAHDDHDARGLSEALVAKYVGLVRAAAEHPTSCHEFMRSYERTAEPEFFQDDANDVLSITKTFGKKKAGRILAAYEAHGVAEALAGALVRFGYDRELAMDFRDAGRNRKPPTYRAVALAMSAAECGVSARRLALKEID